MADLALARRSLAAFADMVGCALAPFQAAALALEVLVTCIVAPRQSGKSRSLAVLALWWAYRSPGQRVLIVSAGDEAAKRLLAEVRRIAAGSPLLRGSVVDEASSLVTLSNGSEIRSVPASERQVRGWSVDLLLVDEAALVPDDLLLGAAFPTVAARRDARIVLASSATTAAGGFYDHVMLGRQGAEQVRAFAWALVDCLWIAPRVIAAARESMSPARFSAEYEGIFASGADSLYPRYLLERATADYVMPGLHGLAANAGLAGVDWGATTDRSALVAVGRLGAPAGLFGVLAAHAWPSGHPLDGPGGVIGEIAALPADFEQVSMETNGLGLPCAQALARRIRAGEPPRPELAFITTTQESKSATYGALRMVLEQGRFVLPASATELLRELLLLRVTLTQQGGERIEAGVGHDDLADALYLAAGPYQDQRGDWRTRLVDAAERESVPESVPDRGDTVTTGAGLRMPRVPALARVGVPRASWRPMFGPGERPGLRARGLDVGEGGRLVELPAAEAEREHAKAEAQRRLDDPYSDPEGWFRIS